MKNLLYLVHRLPYPPNKGDKITSFNMLKYLSDRFNIFLGCFVDDLRDWQYRPEVEKYCKQLCTIGLKPATAKFRSLLGLLTGEALSLTYYRNAKLQAWVDRVFEEYQIDAVMVLSGVMAQYVSPHLNQKIRSVLDLEDVDSDKWQLLAKEHGVLLSWILNRESVRLLHFERAMAQKFDITLLVSKREAELFKMKAPEVARKTTFRVQGVDCSYFDPSLRYENPYAGSTNVLVFTGAMDYWPNSDAVIWFAKEVIPRIRQAVPNVCFCIVGMNPTRKVKALAEDPSIIVTGGVPDVRPYLAHAAAAALPLRIARGIQNKVLEAMAMEKPILATPNAIYGMDLCPGFSPYVSATAEGLAEKAIALLNTEVQETAGARACVLKHNDWEVNLGFIHRLLSEDLSTMESLSPDIISHVAAEKTQHKLSHYSMERNSF